MGAPQSAKDVFTGMLATLALPAHWLKGFGARRHDGQPCDPCSPSAYAFCLYGARDRELGKVADPFLREQLDEQTDEILHGLTNGVSPSAVNDDRSTTHQDVVDLVRQAQAKAPA